MTARPVRTAVLSGLAPVVLIALVFGNEWAVSFAARHDLAGGDLRGDGNGIADSLGRLLALLQFPSWRLSGSFRFVAVQDVALLLLFAVSALLGLAALRAVDPRRGAMAVLAVGWWATVVAGGVAGLTRALLTVVVGNFPSTAASNLVWSGMGGGALFGLVYGWLPGLAMLLAFLATRPREQAPVGEVAAPHGGAPGAQGAPPPLPQRVPQTSYSPPPRAGQWPSARQGPPSWPAPQGPTGHPPPAAYGPPPDRDDDAT